MKKLTGLVLSDLEKYRDAYDLAEIIGVERFERVLDVFAGQPIYIPERRQIFIQCRNRAIIKEYKEGISVRSLAVKYELSVVWITKLVRDHEVQINKKEI